LEPEGEVRCLLRRGGVDREEVRPGRRGGHSLLHHDRLPVAEGRERDDKEQRHEVTGEGGERRAGAEAWGTPAMAPYSVTHQKEDRYQRGKGTGYAAEEVYNVILHEGKASRSPGRLAAAVGQVLDRLPADDAEPFPLDGGSVEAVRHRPNQAAGKGCDERKQYTRDDAE